jgi:hypothetical protein
VEGEGADMPFSISKVLKRKDANLTIQWYGNMEGILNAPQLPGWYYQNPEEGEVWYFADKKEDPSHEPYTNTHTGTEVLSTDHVYLNGFPMNKNFAIPKAVLKEISACKDIDWYLPEHQMEIHI